MDSCTSFNPSRCGGIGTIPSTQANITSDGGIYCKKNEIYFSSHPEAATRKR